MNVNIPEKYTDLYIKALQDRKKVLQEKIQQFNTEIGEIDSHLNNLTSLQLFQENRGPVELHYNPAVYQDEWPWTKKIAHYQDVKRKLVKASDIVDFIVEKEPTLNKAKVRSSISAALSNKIKKEDYRKFTDPVSGNTYYGPPAYFINKQEPHLEFMPEELKERLLYNK